MKKEGFRIALLLEDFNSKSNKKKTKMKTDFPLDFPLNCLGISRQYLAFPYYAEP